MKKNDHVHISQIIPFSFVDGPGNRFALFLQGCLMDCPYCHNPETKSRKINAKGSKWMGLDELLSKIEHSRPFIRGVTVSGGEPLLQKSFLKKLLPELKKLNLTAFLNTNAYLISPKEDSTWFSDWDGVMVDIKSAIPSEHQKLTGLPLEPILQNIAWLIKIDRLFEIRTVIIPDLINNEETVKRVAQFLIEQKAEQIPYRLLPYRPEGVLSPYKEQLRVPNQDQLDDLKKIFTLEIQK